MPHKYLGNEQILPWVCGRRGGGKGLAWHFPSLSPMVPDSLLSDTGLPYPVVPPYPIHRLRWVLGPLPSTGGKPLWVSLMLLVSTGDSTLRPPISKGTGSGSTGTPQHHPRATAFTSAHLPPASFLQLGLSPRCPSARPNPAICATANSLQNALLPSSGNPRNLISRTYNHSLTGPRELR